MAIKTNAILRDKNPSSVCSSNTSNISACRLIKINFAGNENYATSRFKKSNNDRDIKSPYLSGDKVNLLSRVTEKKLANKKPTHFFSSFPLAVGVYKANSDEFKRPKRGNKKCKKSVLTLPNDPAPIPNTHTVSDLNDSEYLTGSNDCRVKPKKRRSIRRNKKVHRKDRLMEYYDRDARYCSQLNIDLDCSSSDILNIDGDGEKISKLSYKSNKPANADSDSHDVWKMLRKINKFQFRPSLPASEESIAPMRKMKPLLSKGNNHNDTRIIETCMQEFAYISSFEIDHKSPSSSPSSSFDRVTVIDTQSVQDEVNQQLRPNILDTNSNVRGKGKNNIINRNKEKNKSRLKNNYRGVQNKTKIKDFQTVANITQNKILQPQKDNIPAFYDNFLPNIQELDNKNSYTSINSVYCNDSIGSSIPGNIQLDNNETKTNNKRSGNINKTYKPKNLIKNYNLTLNEPKLVDNIGKLNGITRIMLSKEENAIVSDPPKKPRLALTLPNTNITRLTQTEIKRRLANLKFPITILGNDQITNHVFCVENYDPPQFNGLDQQIWPFMLHWSEKILSENSKDCENLERLKIKSKGPKVKHKVASLQVGSPDYEEVEKYKIDANSDFPIVHQRGKEVPLHINRPPKPISILKNKMFQFLQKKSSLTNTENTCNDTGRRKFRHREELGHTIDTTKKIELNINEDRILREKRFVDKSYSSLRYPWAKAKRGSDFIENIIKKIRNGVYYGVDRKEIKYKTDGAEVSTQTESNILRNAYCQNSADTDFALKLVLSKRDDPLKIIPGFESTLSTLEIETISTKQIAVKDGITNVVVQFDIQVLAEADSRIQTNNSISCIPVKNKDEKIFKYTTSIHNAILPAELCSIIPTMMRNILKGGKKLYLPAATAKIGEPDLINISELKKSKCSDLTMHPILPALAIPDKIKPLLNGKFAWSHSNQRIVRAMDLCMPSDEIDYRSNFNPTIAIALQLLWQFIPVRVISIATYSNLSSFKNFDQKPIQNLSRNSNCLALQLYYPRNLRIIPSFGIFNLTQFLSKLFDKIKLNILLYPNCFSFTSFDYICNNEKSIFCDTQICSLREHENIMPLSPITKVGVISLFNGYTKCRNNYDKTSSNFTTQNGNDNKEDCLITDKSKTELRKKGQPVKKLRKKSYIKCYRKCNSMSSISTYKGTPLNKITNLDDFCQALGSNSLRRVLEGCPERKILAAVVEMKNWISEITPKQALLVLLLTNKKDTRNLIRFRPVLLQGIAVNRITRAVELDTEIEVIERENFHKLPQFEGISYLPASMENQDNLFEELYWIAKTTASDYQKPFDETSEKLLKSLLEKRKKLNPSYLRVMARYVGLGLLSPPLK